MDIAIFQTGFSFIFAGFFVQCASFAERKGERIRNFPFRLRVPNGSGRSDILSNLFRHCPENNLKDRSVQTTKIERHIYEGAGHAWDCFPYFPKSLVAKDPGKFGRLLKKLEGVCANKFDGPNKAVTEDAFKRTLAFFKKP